MKINEVVTDWDTFERKENFKEVIVNSISFMLPKGVIWKCVGCGNCCKTNEIPITLQDKSRIKKFLSENRELRSLRNKFFKFKGISMDSHSGYYLRKIKMDKSITFKNKEFNEQCIFLKNNKCLIHSTKPAICKKYPFDLLPRIDFTNPNHFFAGFSFEGSILPAGKKILIGRSGTEKESEYVCNGFSKAPNPNEVQDLETIKIVAKAINELLKDLSSLLTTGI